jgi:O-antigen/teichoic acid export membrane protein
MVLMPGLSVLLSFQRAIQVSSRETGSLTWSTSLEVIGIIVVLFLVTFFLNTIGAIAATAAFIIGRLVANLYLIKPNQRSRQKMSK